MPPRSKSSRVEFVTCELCHHTFSSKDQDKHANLCNSEAGSSDLFPIDFPYNFVLHETLYGTPCVVEATPEHLPKSLYSDVILIHPSAMQLCNMDLGRPVRVFDVGHFKIFPQVFTVWPHPSAPLSSIGFLQENPLSKAARLTVDPLFPPFEPATEVYLKSKEQKPFFHSAEFSEYVLRKFEGKFLTVGNKISLNYFGQPCQLEVTSIIGRTDPKPKTAVSDITEDLASLHIDFRQNAHTFYKISSTKFIVQGKKAEDPGRLAAPTVCLEQLGGLEQQIKSLTELLDLHFKPRKGHQIGLNLPKGILLYGPSGTGKSILSKALINYSNVHSVSVQGSEIWSRYFGESESRLSSLFQEAQKRAPSIIFIDEIDVLCPRKESSQTELERRVVSTLLTLIDSTFSAEVPVVVLAATNNRDQVNTGLRRPGRLDREVEIGVPNAGERIQILMKLLKSIKNNLTPVDIKNIGDRAHGFVGADLAAVCKEAGLHAMKQRSGRGDGLNMSLDDIVAAMEHVQPSAMREVALEVPQVSWDDIGGQEDLKHKLRQAIEWPLKHPESFTRLGIRPPRGLLMYGPPGCSKTMVAKALARESGLNFLAIKGPELFSKWVGESERAVRELFRKARAAAPAIVFFDEIDSIAGERGSGGNSGSDVGDRVLAQLLTEIDGVVALKDVTVVAATNRPDRIDKALLRPGRLDRIVYVPLPDETTRKEIFKIQFKKTPVAEDVDTDWLVEKTDMYSGAEVSAVCHEAALAAMEEEINIRNVSRRHFVQALQTVTPRISPDMIHFYNDYASRSGLHTI